MIDLIIPVAVFNSFVFRRYLAFASAEYTILENFGDIPYKYLMNIEWMHNTFMRHCMNTPSAFSRREKNSEYMYTLRDIRRTCK